MYQVNPSLPPSQCRYTYAIHCWSAGQYDSVATGYLYLNTYGETPAISLPLPQTEGRGNETSSMGVAVPQTGGNNITLHHVLHLYWTHTHAYISVPTSCCASSMRETAGGHSALLTTGRFSLYTKYHLNYSWTTKRVRE